VWKGFPPAAVPAAEALAIVPASPTGAAISVWLDNPRANVADVDEMPRRAIRPRNFSNALSTRMRAAFSLKPSLRFSEKLSSGAT
jgi:hypothetical protein